MTVCQLLILSIGALAVYRLDKNPCPYGTYILVGETGNKPYISKYRKIRQGNGLERVGGSSSIILDRVKESLTGSDI